MHIRDSQLYAVKKVVLAYLFRLGREFTSTRCRRSVKSRLCLDLVIKTSLDYLAGGLRKSMMTKKRGTFLFCFYKLNT